jgi:hypothetical protein
MGFLGRMAARATGAAPAVSPRLLSRFELGEGEAADASEEVVGRTRARAPAAPPPTPMVAAPVRISEPTVEPPRVRAAESTPSATEPAAAQPPTVTTPVPPPPSRAAQPLSLPAIDLSRELVPAAEAAARSEEVLDRRPVAPVIVAAIPVPQRADTLATLPPAADRPGAGEPVAPNAPDVVHISIGRVEVRATVARPAPAAAAVQPANQPAEAALSLGDYLRGKREPS